MKEKLIQIIYDLKMQPLVGWVTVVATAMAVFLIMVVVMMQRINIVPFPPESCRDRLLVGKNIHLRADHLEVSSYLSYDVVKELYGGLDGVEEVSYFMSDTYNSNVVGSTGETFPATIRDVDGQFFKIFDHPLVAGRYFSEGESESHVAVAVISKSTAIKAFGTTDCINSTLKVNHFPYKVVGVVNDNTALARMGSGEVFKMLSTNPEDRGWRNLNIFGHCAAALLVEPGADIDNIREQVKGRYAALNTRLAPDSVRAIYHQSPYTAEVYNSDTLYTNTDPDVARGRRIRYLFYLILLIVPAINLSGMLHSRLRRRVSEIGIRRAFGCTRRRIITDIVVENMIVTLVGGLVGLAAGIIFAYSYTGLYETWSNFGENLRPALGSILNLGTILIALGVCLVLNVISAAVPAWQASRIDPVEAINTK